jgi:hypothetical protein
MANLRYGSLDPAVFAGSMADEIERALNRLLPAGHKLTFDDAEAMRDRRRLFVAIAEGVLRYLEAHENDLELDFTDVPVSGTFEAHLDFEVSQ